MQALRIGGTCIAAWPGEMFVEYGLELKKHAPLKSFVVAYANGELQGYVVTPKAVAAGGYEAASSMFDPSAGTSMGARFPSRMTNSLGISPLLKQQRRGLQVRDSLVNQKLQKFNIGFIGFGFIGKVHAYGYLNLPLFTKPMPLQPKITHICTSRPETAEEGRTLLNAEHAVTDFRQITENPDIDIVHICMPNNNHKEALLSAMKHQKLHLIKR